MAGVPKALDSGPTAVRNCAHRTLLNEVAWPVVADAASYLDDLAGLGCSVDAWETTYLHVLSGPDPVFRWISGTGARPVLQALSEGQRERFVAEYQELLNKAYPTRPYGTVLPFRRIFVVARRGTIGSIIGQGLAVDR